MYTSGLPDTLLASKAQLWLLRSTSGLQGPALATMTLLWPPSPAYDLPSPACDLPSPAYYLPSPGSDLPSEEKFYEL